MASSSQALGAPPPSEEGEQPPSPPPPAPRRFTGVRAAAAAAAAAAASSSSLSESRAIQVAATPSSSAATAIPRRFVRQQVPDDILNDPELAEATSVLPSNYDFEVPKTIWRLRQLGATRVALQFPEGLLLFSLALADIVRAFVPGVVEVTVLGDVAYGACCVDDAGALACAGADALVHYGHSCLVPVQTSTIPTIYVFVHVGCDVDHLISTLELNFYGGGGGGEGGGGEGGGGEDGRGGGEKSDGERLPLAIAGTVQFAPAVAAASAALARKGSYYRPPPIVPQSRPLSPGEVLGCTAPRLEARADGARGGGGGAALSAAAAAADAIVFVADGRFHMEALMIANPSIPAYRYDPYARVLTRERYDHAGMRSARKEAIARASREDSWGFVLGTLGRQGSTGVLRSLVAAARRRGKRASVVLISELSPAKLAALTRGSSGSTSADARSSDDGGGREVERGVGDSLRFSPPRAWAQVACPRLSIDWGEGFGGMPVLTPYEAMVALGCEEGWWATSASSGGRPSDGGGGRRCGGGCGGGGCGGGGAAPPPPPATLATTKASIDLEGDPERGHYPMDYYSSSGGPWAGTYHRSTPPGGRRPPRSAARGTTRASPSSASASAPSAAAPVAPSVS